MQTSGKDQRCSARRSVAKDSISTMGLIIESFALCSSSAGPALLQESAGECFGGSRSTAGLLWAVTSAGTQEERRVLMGHCEALQLKCDCDLWTWTWPGFVQPIFCYISPFPCTCGNPVFYFLFARLFIEIVQKLSMKISLVWHQATDVTSISVATLTAECWLWLLRPLFSCEQSISV